MAVFWSAPDWTDPVARSTCRSPGRDGGDTTRAAHWGRDCFTVPVGASSLWGKTPRQSVEEECKKRGRAAVVTGCTDLLAGKITDPTLVVSLGGRPAKWVIDPEEPPGPEYWLRVWALRGLLWAWDDAAGPPVRRALSDEAWRVREMACKVIARHLVVDALSDVALLEADEVPRVRLAAAKAMKRLTKAGA